MGTLIIVWPPTRYVSIRYWLAASIWSSWAEPLPNAVAEARNDRVCFRLPLGLANKYGDAGSLGLNSPRSWKDWPDWY